MIISSYLCCDSVDIGVFRMFVDCDACLCMYESRWGGGGGGPVNTENGRVACGNAGSVYVSRFSPCSWPSAKLLLLESLCDV